jgi:hypothetical protein
MSQASALVVPEPGQDLRRKLRAVRLERWRQLIEVAARRLDLAAGPQALKGTPFWERGQQGNRPTTVGDLDRLATFDQAQQFACPLPQLPNPD